MLLPQIRKCCKNFSQLSTVLLRQFSTDVHKNIDSEPIEHSMDTSNESMGLKKPVKPKSSPFGKILSEQTSVSDKIISDKDFDLINFYDLEYKLNAKENDFSELALRYHRDVDFMEYTHE